jgi:hypothetical protein
MVRWSGSGQTARNPDPGAWSKIAQGLDEIATPSVFTRKQDHVVRAVKSNFLQREISEFDVL